MPGAAPAAAGPGAAPRPRARRPLTLGRRIAVLALAPAALVVAGGGLWLRMQMHAALYESFAQALADKQVRVATRLRMSPGGHVSEPASSNDEFSAIYSGWYWQAETVPATVASAPEAAPASVAGRSRSLWDAAALIPGAPAGPRALALVQARGPLGEPLLGHRQTVTLNGHPAPLALTVFGPAQTLQTNLRRIDQILLATAVILIGLLAAMLLVQVRVGLAPLRRLTQAIAFLRHPGPTPAPPLDALQVGSDLAPLQHELTALLAQNERVVGRARAHAADLNHALKKPLALLSASASRQPQVNAGEVLQHIGAMTQLIDRYQSRTLSDAMHARATLTGQAVAVRDCLAELVQAVGKLHAAQELDWQLHLPGDARAWRWRGDRTDLEEALGNLLDNAGKWAASQVRISASRQGHSLCIAIEDDGPGMSDEQRQAAGQRGLRFDETVEGTGLGLSIASQIAQAYGGELRLDKSPVLKGLRVELRLSGLLGAAAG
ncbi:sensor histidine kinase [Comamonadaceae bacterium OH2545_COT-014]|nr:sensor histidine kinase [Comamonadaceae bacterium OH2545_COT-014]